METRMEKLEYRMYFFVPYNISKIQMGIQSGHAALRYANTYHKTKEYQKFLENETWIILNGGTTNSFDGSLNKIMDSLYHNNINCSQFYEPDLNNALTAVCFLVDNRVYQGLGYNDWAEAIRNGDPNINPKQTYSEYIGGEKNEFLKELITGKPLA